MQEELGLQLHSSDPASSRVAETPTPLYSMRISRMTVDKLGVRLYDTVGAVVAELIANAYDADAELVTIKAPLATSLARRGATKLEWLDLGHVIEVVDDGHGMTRHEANEHFLQVGRERRRHEEQGPTSRKFKRRVMGRKGIGKLAPFGICRRIEIESAGGEKTASGFAVSHFVMDYDRILAESDAPVELEVGERDGTYQQNTGTTVRLSIFLGKHVADATVFLRQLARRFTPTGGFKVVVEDTRPASLRGTAPAEYVVGPLDVPIQETTRIDVSARPVKVEAGVELQVSGWLALAKDAYKDEETAGVRIYARNKIVGWTRDFEQPAGYTGEFTIRSYLVGEITAEWLDFDDGEDLVKTDRQGIIWDSEYGNALREWGASLIKELGLNSRKPRRARVKNLFLELSNIDERAREEYGDEAVVTAAHDLAEQIGGFAAEDELTDQEYVDELSRVILTVAPHTALMKAFQEFETLSQKGPVDVDKIQGLFRKSRVAELASYGQIAHERVRVIEKLEALMSEGKPEPEFQTLIASAPWLVEPTWSIISENESLNSFKNLFEKWYKDKYGQEVVLAIRHEEKRPDFTLVDVGHCLHIVEIKRSGHVFDDSDAERLLRYADAFEQFLKVNPTLRTAFPLGYRVSLVADGENIKNASHRIAYESLISTGKLRRMTWIEFLQRARTSHEEFLRAARLFREAGQGATT